MKLGLVTIAATIALAACSVGGDSKQIWSPSDEAAFVSQCMSENEVPLAAEALCRCELGKLEEKYPNKAAWESQGTSAESVQVNAECE